MKQFCSTLHLYQDADRGRLSRIVGPIIVSNRNNPDASKMYNAIIKDLQNSMEFYFGNDSVGNKARYNESIKKLKEDLKSILDVMGKRLDNTTLSRLIDLIDKNLLTDAKVTSDDTQVDEDSNEAPVIEGTELEGEEERNSRKLEGILTSMYGSALGALQYREQQFNLNLLKATIIDTNRRVIINNNNDLNISIASFKNAEFSKIITYLKSQDPNFSMSEVMFDEDGELSRDYYSVMNFFYNKLNSIKDVSSLANAGWKASLSGEEDLFLGALNAYVNLQYFDNLILDSLGKSIELTNSALFGQDLAISWNKYTFSKGNEHKVKTWGTSESKDALANVAKFSKLILSTIPIYSSLDNKFLNKYVNIQNFSNAITRLFNKVLYSENVDKTLKDMVEKHHQNPYIWSKAIFKYIATNPSVANKLLFGDGFTRLDLDIINSVYKYVFDTSNPNSIISIETESMKKNFTVDSYSIIDSINGVIDRTMQANYLQVKYDRNQFKTSIKPKYASKKEIFSTVNKINISNVTRTEVKRRQLAETYKLSTPKNNYNTVVIQIGNNALTAIASDGILSNKDFVITAKSSTLFNEVFSGNYVGIDLSSEETINRILSNSKLNASEQIFRDTIKFIDDYLNLNLLSEQGLNLLSMYKSIVGAQQTNYIKGILQTAIRAAVVNNFYDKFNKELKKPGSKYKNEYDFITYMSDEYFNKNKSARDSIDIKKLGHDYFTVRFGIQTLNSVYSSEGWIEQLAFAEAVLNGETSKSTTKDIFKNSIGNYRTSFMGGNLAAYNRKYREAQEKNDVAKTNRTNAATTLFFTNNPDFIAATVINTDAQSRMGVKKNVRNMKTPELLYEAIIHNFYGAFLSDAKNVLHESMVIQPTTYSDKVTFLNYAIRGNKKISAEGKSYDGKTLMQLSAKEVVDLYHDTIGLSYKNLFNNVVNTLRAVFANDPRVTNAKIMTYQDVMAHLETLTEAELLSLVPKGMELQLDTHYRVDTVTGKCKFNELLFHYSQVLYKDSNTLGERLQQEKVRFINNLSRAGVNFYTNYYNDTKEEPDNAPSNAVRAIINSTIFKSQKDEILRKWVKDGKLIIAKVNGVPIMSGELIDFNANLEVNPIIEKYFYLDSLLANNLRLAETGSEVAHPDKSSIDLEGKFKSLGINQNNHPELYVTAKDGTLVPTRNYIKYYTSTDPNVRKLYAEIIRKVEVGAQGTQLKRNVIIPATLQYMQQGNLNGIPAKLKVAVIKDTKAKIWNFRGDRATEDAHDGSAYINPFISILENKSLQDQEVGVDKKPIWHHFNPTTMSATLLKFATFTITAERMRESLDSQIKLYDLFKQMTDLAWSSIDEAGNIVWNNSLGVEFDLVSSKGFKVNGSSKIDFKTDILAGKRLFYKTGSEHREIRDFGRDAKGYYTLERDVYDNGTPINNSAPYLKLYHKFDANSNHLVFTEENVPTEGYSDINSLFQLYNTLGGIYAESLNEDSLALSDIASIAVVNFMNNVIVRKGNDTSDLSQNTYFQPLKEMMISYAANNSSVKVGASNINGSNAWEGQTKLRYMTLDTDGLGIQMDADHDIDEAEMTEFSQVISALEAGGRLHSVSNEVYRSLGKLAIAASSVEIDALDAFIKKSTEKNSLPQEAYRRQLLKLKSSIYDIIGRAVINNYKPNNERMDLATPIIKEIKAKFNNCEDHALDELKIAFSDSNLFSSVISTFMSNINKKSIKRKYPGSGCVMVPGYGIIQLFKVNGNAYQYSDLIVRANKANKKEHFFEDFDASKLDRVSYDRSLVAAYLQQFQNVENTQAIADKSRFIPTDIVDVGYFKDGVFVKLYTQNLDSIDDYYQFKFNKNFASTQVLKYTGQLIPSEQLVFANNVTKGRNLAPARITWEQNGKVTNIFDTEEVRESFGYDIEGNKIPREVNRDAIQKVFNELANNKYHGQPITNLQNLPAELVMSNLYASKFGTGGKSLADILEKGEDFFKIKKRLPVLESKYFDLAFTTNNNKSVFFTFLDVKESSDSAFKPKKNDWKYTKTIGDEVYATTKEGEILFKIGKYIKKIGITYDEEAGVFKNADGKVIISNKLRRGEDGTVLEYQEFISRYTVAEKIGNKGKINSYTLYKINKDAIERAFKATSSNVKSYDINEQVGKILANIYSAGTYSGIRLKSVMINNSARDVSTALAHMENYSPEKVRALIRSTCEYLKDAHTNKAATYSVYDKTNAEGITYEQMLINYYNSLSSSKFASFKRSLYYTASRIPAQTLQSFMQMQLMGFTQSSKNICYVSHWQTYLQGSDYDIDKAYIMGLEFTDDGMYEGWSNLFDYSSEATLRSSEDLPIPVAGMTFTKSTSGFDISPYLEEIYKHKIEGNKSSEIATYARLLRDIESTYGAVKGNIKITYNPSIDKILENARIVYDHQKERQETLGEEIIRNLNLHTSTVLTAEKLEAALKNSVSSRIQRTIQDPRNMDQAYTSIDGEMTRIRKAAEKSPKGLQSSDISLMDPATKFMMQEQNMTGKGVIGISAVGEKVFFNWSNYWNEGIRSNDTTWITNLKFQKTFSRILGRDSGNLQTRTCTTLANVNFDGVEDMRKQFAVSNDLDNMLRIKYSITDNDIYTKSDSWKKYNSELITELEKLQEYGEYVDLNISSLLSAATDNAKELILDKINAGTDLARCHLFLIMMGFGLNDIANFMVSPAVSIVNELANANMFDEYNFKSSVNEAIKALNGNINVKKFFYGYIKDANGEYRSVEELAFFRLKNAGIIDLVADIYPEIVEATPAEVEKYTKSGRLLEIISEPTAQNKKFKVALKNNYTIKTEDGGKVNLSKLVSHIAKARFEGKLNKSLEELFKSGIKSRFTSFNRINNNIVALSDFIENIYRKIESSINSTIEPVLKQNPGLYTDAESIEILRQNAIADFNKDLAEFEQIYELATEISTVGGVFLGLNQGLPTSMSALINLVFRIENAMISRQNKLGVTSAKITKNLNGVVLELLDNNPTLDAQYIANVLVKANSVGMIDNFDGERWLVDAEYKKIASDYYNVIKGTCNAFDLIERLPQYKAIIDLLRTSIAITKNISKKSHVVWLMARNLFKAQKYVDEDSIDKLLSYADDLLILNWINKGNFKMPVFKGDEIFEDNFSRRVSTHDVSYILIDSEPNRASFKLLFEKMIESLKDGEYTDVENGVKVKKEIDKNNSFLQNLVSDTTSNGSIFWKLNLDMQKVNATPYNNKKYQECLDGFIKLKNYTFNGRPLTDWFMLYNFVVNKNMWGSDRLTSLFGPFLNSIRESSVIKDYFTETGEMDWEHLAPMTTLEDLEDIGYTENDAYYKIAPIISVNQEIAVNSRFVLEFENGAMILKRNVGDSYIKIPYLLSNTKSSSSETESDELQRQKDYMNYCTIQTPFFNEAHANETNIASNSVEKLLRALINYTKNGVFEIYEMNC